MSLWALIACFDMALQNTPTFPLQTISADPVQQRGCVWAEQSRQALSVVGMRLPAGTITSCTLQVTAN